MLKRFLLFVVALIVALGLAELGLRLFMPDNTFGVAERCDWMNRRLDWYELDPEFGWRPRLGKGKAFNRFGTRKFGYPIEKRPGIERLLFIGDSVTFDGTIIHALGTHYGTEKFEYWNAGVPSFNTLQEVRFYQKYNRGIRPDHVILSFHANDFETTPIAYQQDGQVVLYAPRKPLRSINPWLFRHCRLYRFAQSITLGGGHDSAGILDEIRGGLRDLRDELARDGIRFSVLVLPMFHPPKEWSPATRAARRMALGLMRELDLRHFDLLPPMLKALKEGIRAGRSPDDVAHPNPELSVRFGAFLHANQLLDPPPK